MNEQKGKDKESRLKVRVAKWLTDTAGGLLASDEDQITDSESDDERPENPANNSPELAMLPLSPDEMIRATQVLESDQARAMEAFELEAANRATSDVINWDDHHTRDEMREAHYALIQLRDMFAGKEVPLYEKGEPIEPFLDKMIRIEADMNCKMMRTDPRYKALEMSALSTDSMLYRYARIRRIHQALIENPAAARATIFGEYVPIDGVNDPAYRENMFGKMTYGSLEDVINAEPIAA